MLKVKDYDSMLALYPEASFIASDLGGGISSDDDDALRFSVKPVYFEDGEGRHYFDALPFSD